MARRWFVAWNWICAVVCCKSRALAPDSQFYLKQRLPNANCIAQQDENCTDRWSLPTSPYLTDALDKKQDAGCPNPSAEVQACIAAGQRGDADTACGADCRSALIPYFNNCVEGDGLVQECEQACGAAGTVVALFTIKIISAVLVAIGNWTERNSELNSDLRYFALYR